MVGLRDAQELGRLLKLANVSREQVAAWLDVSKDSVNSWCVGRTAISLPHLSKLVNLLRDAGLPSEMVHRFLVRRLDDLGMTAECVDVLGGGNSRVTADSVVLLGSHMNSGSHQMVGLGIRDAMSDDKQASHFIALDTFARQDLLDHYVTLVLQTSARAVIIDVPLLGAHERERIVQRVASRDLPCVFLFNAPMDLPDHCAAIRPDNARVASVGTATLLRKGHKDIMALAMDRLQGQRDRVGGYCKAMEDAGYEPRILWSVDPNDVPRPFSAADRPDLQEAARAIALDSSLDAVITLSMLGTRHVIRALNDAGRRPGTDVSLLAIGCWDWMHDIAVPPITHIATPYYDVGRVAGTLALTMAMRKLPLADRDVVVPPRADAIHRGDRGTVRGLA